MCLQCEDKGMAMNAGERAELKQIATLACLIDKTILISGIELKIDIVEIPKARGGRTLIPRLPNNITPESLSVLDDTSLLALTNSHQIKKAPAKCKADVYINNVGYSLKYTGSSPPAIVNHTSRNGWENIATLKRLDISDLDSIINDYWKKRISGLIGEDITNTNPESPFAEHLNVLLPYLDYFSFEGTGSSISLSKADFVIECDDPCDIKTWELIDKTTYIKRVWPRLVFSLRSKKGMPKDISKSKYRDSINQWSHLINEELKGALHVRLG